MTERRPSTGRSQEASYPEEAVRLVDREIKISKQRWLLMILFLMYTVVSAFQCMQLSIINNIVVKYYGVSPTMVEWTSQIFLLSYVLFVFPTLYLQKKMGNRYTMIMASAVLSVATWIKALSVESDRFPTLMLGQTLASVVYTLNYGLSARFTALWFGAKEISIAGALALVGDQVGMSLGFLIPPMIVKGGPHNVIKNEMSQLLVPVAIISTVTCILITLFFAAEPKNPPSIAQMKQKEVDFEQFWSIVGTMISNPAFLITTASYSLCIAVANAVQTLLNELVLHNYPNKTKDAGNIGFLIQICGLIGSLIVSYFLDKTKKFKESSIFLTTGSVISMILFMISLKANNLLYLYIAAMLIGFFLQSYFVTGLQMCIEVTYPILEGMSTAIMFLFVQLSCLILTASYSYLMKHVGDVISNLLLVAVLLLSTIFAWLIPPILHRQAVEHAVRLPAESEQ